MGLIEGLLEKVTKIKNICIYIFCETTKLDYIKTGLNQNVGNEISSLKTEGL